MQNFRPEHILITGASSGIGAALAEAYAAPGILLSLTGRNQARLADIAEKCRTRGADVRLYTEDLTDSAALAIWLESSFDTMPIDLVIANAGISGGSGGVLNNCWPESSAQIKAIFEINLVSALNTITPILPRMRVRGGGHIALMSSMAGFFGMPSAPSYSTSKVALRIYADAVRPLLKPYHIDISVIFPGFVRTPLTDINDFPMPMMMTAERAAKRIITGLDRRKKHIAFPFALHICVLLIAVMPLWLRDKILGKLPGKPEIKKN